MTDDGIPETRDEWRAMLRQVIVLVSNVVGPGPIPDTPKIAAQKRAYHMDTTGQPHGWESYRRRKARRDAVA